MIVLVDRTDLYMYRYGGTDLYMYRYGVSSGQSYNIGGNWWFHFYMYTP